VPEKSEMRTGISVAMGAERRGEGPPGLSIKKKGGLFRGEETRPSKMSLEGRPPRKKVGIM